MSASTHALEGTLASIVRGDLRILPNSLDIPALLEAASQHGVRTFVARTLRNTLDPTRTPELRQSLDNERALGGAFEALRHREVQAVVQELSDRGVVAVLLKGSALAYALYADPSDRPRFDTDLFVRRADLTTIDEVMTTRGYVRANQVSGSLVLHQMDYVRTDKRGIRHLFDFHWKLANRQAVAGILTFEEVLQHSVAANAITPSARAIGSVHALLHACVHRLAHHAGEDRLIWFYDIHLLMHSLTPAELVDFENLAISRSTGAICAAGIEEARRWFGTRVPDGLIARLKANAEAEGEPSAALINLNGGSLNELIADLRAAPGWAGRARLMYEHAFPPPSYIAGRYMVSNRMWLPALYTHRLVLGAWKWVREATR